MVSQLFVELSMEVLGDSTDALVLARFSFRIWKIFLETTIILKRRLRFCLRFRITIIFEYWVHSSIWRLGSQTNTSFLCSHWFFLEKLLVETATRKCLISVYGKDYCGDSCNWEIHFSVTTKKRRRIDRRPCSELKVWRSCWSTYLSQRKCILLYRQSCPLHRGVLEGTVFMLQCTI